MTAFKTTTHILSSPFEWIPKNLNPNFRYTVTEKNNFNNIPDINDVQYWQQLYYDAGLIGVYVAYQPRGEFYLITYNMFIDQPKGVETFYGENAVQQVINRCKELGIELPIDMEWVKEIN